MITGRLKWKEFMFLVLLFLGMYASFSPSAFAADEAAWRKKQQDVISVVQRLTRIGTKFPAFRCGLYIPGHGVCYMKMTAVKCNSGADSNNVPPEYVADVAEVIEVSTMLGKQKTLDKKEQAVIQTRFMNTTYLRMLSSDLITSISVTPQKNYLAYKKLLEDIVTYIDGSYKTRKTDVWVSVVTEKFTQGGLPITRVSGEGTIIPDKAIVLYQRYPGIYEAKGEKALADKLYDTFKSSSSLVKYYGSYDLAIGVESGPQLLFASYPIKKVASLKRDGLKYFRFADTAAKAAPAKTGTVKPGVRK